MFYVPNVVIILSALPQCFSLIATEILPRIDPDFTFSLRNFTANGSTPLDSTKVLPSQSQFIVQVLDIPETVSFIVVQAHSYLYSVSLSYSSELKPKLHINGTNIGLVYYITNSQSATVFLQNSNVFNVTTMVAVSPYTNNAAIPGGCNLEFSTYTAPYLDLNFTSSTVVVGGQPAMAPEDVKSNSCNGNDLTYKMYQLYSTERDFSQEMYFDSIRSMLSPESARINGFTVRDSVSGPPLKHVFGAYRGTGAVYTLVALTRQGIASAYVPTHTYACNNGFIVDACQTLDSTFSKVICALVMFTGLFLCFLGHCYFSLELFTMGLALGGMVSFILLKLSTSTALDYVAESTVLGAVCGLIWCVLWWTLRSPILSVTLPILNLGFLVAATVFFAGIGDLSVLERDANYWLTLASIALAVLLILLAAPKFSNMLSCSVIGGYAVILPIDYYAGTSFKYILLNVINRAIAEDFDIAKTTPPFQTPDVILSVVWLGAGVCGLWTQTRLSQGRSPFPPPSRFCAARYSSDLTTPLLAHATYSQYSPGSDNVFHA